jgi:hypothetical protein
LSLALKVNVCESQAPERPGEMKPGRDAPDRSYHQTADWTRRRPVDCVPDAMKFHSTSRASRRRVFLLMRPLRQGGTDLHISEGQQRRARIHRKFDLMKQTQDHDGDVRTGGGETEVVENSLVYR